MARIIITKGCAAAWGGKTEVFRKGETLEDPGGIAAAVTAGGGAFRTLALVAGAASPSRDQLGESVGVSNSSP